MDRPGVCQVPEGGGEQGKMEETGCKIICGAPTTLVVKGQMQEREIVLLGFLLWKIKLAFRGENQLQQSHYPTYGACWVFCCFTEL